jgi:hypothetical protein
VLETAYLKVINNFKFSIIVSRDKTYKHVNYEDHVHYHVENIILFGVYFREGKSVRSDSARDKNHSKCNI